MKSSSAGLTSLSRWQQLMTEHAMVSAKYRTLGESAATGDEATLEEQADTGLREIAHLEEFALSLPAEDIATFRFKFLLWANGRVDGFEKEWSIFAADFERLFLGVAGKKPGV
jgi:hypothetical protein